MSRRDYLIPDYYPAFRCKMGACRHACCEGWPVSITMKDYFTLLGTDCSPELRRRLDTALHLAEHPTQEAYARILPRYDGTCPLHLPDGRCALHAELGEEALAAVCRLYPRGVRTGETHECSCANSCEAVAELLLDRQEPLAFITRPIDFPVPEAPPRRFHFETAGREQALRMRMIALMQDRSQPLPARLIALGDAMAPLAAALKAHDTRGVEAFLTGPAPAPRLQPPTEEDLRFGMEIAGGMLALIDERSVSVRACGEKALAYFGGEEGRFARYTRARGRLAQLLPQGEIWLEHLLVNHMFFSQFPFQDRPVELMDEFVALCAVYLLLRFLLAGNVAADDSAGCAADVAAAAFRLIAHTEFDRYAAPLLKSLGCGDRAHMLRALSL